MELAGFRVDFVVDVSFKVEFLIAIFFTIMLVEIDDAVEFGSIVEANVDIVVDVPLEVEE